MLLFNEMAEISLPVQGKVDHNTPLISNYWDVTLTPSCNSFAPLTSVFAAFDLNSISEDIYVCDRFCPL